MRVAKEEQEEMQKTLELQEQQLALTAKANEGKEGEGNNGQKTREE